METSLRLPQLDSLRGIACLMVLISHLRAVPCLSSIPDCGAFGVGIFFALSGFLITSGLVESTDLWRFYNRRVSRILPIYFLTLFAIALVWPHHELIWVATFCFNWLFVSPVHSYFHIRAQHAPVGHFWSLCVEEHFYLVWPLFVAYLPRRLVHVLPLIVVVLTPLVYWQAEIVLRCFSFQQTEITDLLQRWTGTNLVALSLGSFAGLHREWLFEKERSGRFEISRSFFCACLLGIVEGLGLFYYDFLPEQCLGTFQQVACAATFLLGLSLTWLGRCSWLAAIGRISYGLYLFHLPIYAAFGLVGDQPATISNAIAAVICTAVLAILSWFLLESRAIRFGRTKLGRSWLGATVSATLAICSVSTLAFEWIGILPRPVASLVDRVDTVVVGSSHAMNGIMTAEMEGTAYNLGTPGQDAYESAMLVRYSILACKRLNTAIVVISPFTFDYVSEYHDSTSKAEMLWTCFGIPRRFDRNAGQMATPTTKRLFIRRGVPESDRTQECASFLATPERGFVASNGDFIDGGVGAAKQHEDIRHPSRFDENLALLVELSKECSNHGVRVIFVATPVYKSYRDNFPEQSWAEFNRGMKELETITGNVVRDFSNDPRFDETDYANANHLSPSGAKKFTQILEQEVLNSADRR